MFTEILVWREASEAKPDVDETVLVAMESGSEPVWLGYFDGIGWRDDFDMSIKVRAWSTMPAGLPQKIMEAVPCAI